MSEVIEIVVGSWRRGRKFACKACGKGKFQAEQPTCPKCNQQHKIMVQL